jgi:REP element-mobilizing transposase RayT
VGRRPNRYQPGAGAKGILWAEGPTDISQGQRPWKGIQSQIIFLSPNGAIQCATGTAMPQSLSKILIHLVFSTKSREPLIHRSVEADLHAYGATVLTNGGCPALVMNGTADHVHVLFHLSRTKTLADVVEELKTSTSKWIKTKGSNFRGFHWQSGYGAFSVSPSNVEQVREYIRQQKEHHRVRSFQDEFRELLNRDGITFDERYVWD